MSAIEKVGGNTATFLDKRVSSNKFLKKNLAKVFPDHWSFMLGEIALYSFIILLLTGTFLTFFYVPSVSDTTYHGVYAPLTGQRVSEAYASTLRLSFDVRGGLLMRQIHHWAALIFVAATVVHMFRIFFTGAFRKPRELNWVIGSTLALLAIVGGFLAPILISTGNGNHVALFGYYALLNAAVFGIAWIRPWRALNLLGFAFTFGIGTFWGTLSYRPELFASTEPFLLLFFAFYLLIPLLYALRQAPDRRDLIDGTLVFGTPLIAFALQVALLEHASVPLAWTALGAAVIYIALAALELRRWNLLLLGQSHALLALGFATLAVPLALSARSTSCTWAIEGAALIWFGLRQQRQLPRWIGYALQGAAACAFVIAYAPDHPDRAILNGQFFSALLIALSALASARHRRLAGS